MIKVHFAKLDPDDDVQRRDVWLNGDTRAVLSEPYADLDEGQGGLTYGDLRPEDIRTLAEFEPGTTVLIESEEPTDVLDDTDEATGHVRASGGESSSCRPKSRRSVHPRDHDAPRPLRRDARPAEPAHALRRCTRRPRHPQLRRESRKRTATQGGLPAPRFNDADVRLAEFLDGADVYVEGEAGDVLDDTTDERAVATRMWGRARVIER